MHPKTNEPTWKRLQRGQSLMEYWPTIPASVAIMIGAAILVSFVNTAFLRTLNGLESYCTTGESITQSAEVHDHKVEPSGVVYDPATNRTTIAYTVTSGSKPSLSHWTLGLSKAVANNIVKASEDWVWTDYDPTTGAVGVKFDIEYEADKGKASASGLMMASYSRIVTVEAASSTGVRIISLTLDGNYAFGAITVTTKAGSDQVGVGTVTGPIERIDDDSDGGKDNGSGIDRSKGC